MYNHTKTIVYISFFVAIGLVLPMLAHFTSITGQVLLPMHIPVLIAGFVLPMWGSIAVALITPILSSILTAMPPPVVLPTMTVELVAYAIFSNLAYRFLGRTKLNKNVFRIYISLVFAMILGRAVGMITNILVFGVIGTLNTKLIVAWLTNYFVLGTVGVVIQILLVPPIVMLLEKRKLLNE